ncbi:hypothetical protein ACEZCY_34015 [Streptacidiphilus sp. N1-12]|uniref:Uncharacterized protein n=2 Tax=Streptacidiphilus alkalitolerans TaxID=3342712 RepID=A0ABV6X8N3_9ACTN
MTPLRAARLRPTSRTIDQAGWAEAGVPLLRSPRELITELHRVHRPQPGTVVLAVLEQDDRVVGGASFPSRVGHGDGWQYRNAILAHLRRVVPHDLRLARPVRTAVLLLCRRGTAEWTEEDGPWMWGLKDASSLHGLRCGAYVTLADTGWQVIGEHRAGRHPHAGSWSEETVRTLSPLPVRGSEQPLRMLEAPSAEPAPAPAVLERSRVAAR